MKIGNLPSHWYFSALKTHGYCRDAVHVARTSTHEALDTTDDMFVDLAEGSEPVDANDCRLVLSLANEAELFWAESVCWLIEWIHRA